MSNVGQREFPASAKLSGNCVDRQTHREKSFISPTFNGIRFSAYTISRHAGNSGDGTCLAVEDCVESIRCRQAVPHKPMAFRRYDDWKYQTPAIFRTSQRRGSKLKLAGWRASVLYGGDTPLPEVRHTSLPYSCSRARQGPVQKKNSEQKPINIKSIGTEIRIRFPNVNSILPVVGEPSCREDGRKNQPLRTA